MRAFKRFAVFACIFVNLARAQEKNEISFQLIRDYVIVVRGEIGGEKNLHFIVDTGAVPSVLDKRLVKHLASGAQESLLVFRKNVDLTAAEAVNVKVGPWQRPSLPVLVSDLSFASEALGVQVDGMLGLDFFASMFVIDYRRKKLGRLNTYDKAGGQDLIIRHSPGTSFATVEMKIGEKTLKLLADSGTSDLVFFKSRVQDCIDNMKIVGASTWSNMGGELAMQRVRLHDASVAGRSWSNREALVMDAVKGPRGLDGMLGLSALGTPRVLFVPPELNADATPAASSPR